MDWKNLGSEENQLHFILKIEKIISLSAAL